MIIVRLHGGLGNQLFQYATARRLKELSGSELLLDASWFDSRKTGVTERPYELSHYTIQGRTMMASDVFLPALYRNKVLKRLPLPRPLKLVREKRFSFQSDVLSLRDNVYLDGYWQSHKYFSDIRDVLLKELEPVQSMSDEDKLTAKQIDETTSVSLHVRRGDYVTLASAAQTHGLCTLEYYKSAVALVQERFRNPTFFVFSDDPEWTRANLHFDSPTVYINHNGPDNAFQDLRLMSLCEHQIIANSSFSWWAAWINKNAEKAVLAPKKWFANRPDVTEDLFPASWIKL
jgi:hypothetical protein